MNKSNPPDAGLAKSSLAKQATSIVRDFAGFAGLNGVWAAALAVIAAAFESGLQHSPQSVVGKPTSERGRNLDALAIAEAAEFVHRLKDGLDTVLGERGVLISGGERQRLCLARAALGRPWLFVLDEATSAIDVATERKILKRMLDLNPRPTIVMIAHRDQSLAYCDRMLRFQNGRFVSDESPVTV